MGTFLYIDEMTVIVVFGLAFFACVPFIIIGVVYYILRKNRKAVVAWEKLAWEIKFSMPEKGRLWMKGDYNGFESHIRIRVESHRSQDGPTRTETFTYCTMKFPKPLRFALLLSAPKSIFSGLGTPSLRIGNTVYDDKFESVCYDPGVLQRLLLSEFPSNETSNLMGDLLLAERSFDTVIVSDTHVKVETSGQIANPVVIKAMLATTYRLAKRFTDARLAFPDSEWEKALKNNWREIAVARSLEFDEEKLTIGGTIGRYFFGAKVAAEPGRWKTTIDVNFPQPLMIGFNIYPELSIHKAVKLLGFQDIKSGHEKFDGCYIVKAKNVSAAKAKMTTEFCDQMVGLDQHTHDISLTDAGMKITLEQVLGDDNSLMSYVKAMISAMEKLR